MSLKTLAPLMYQEQGEQFRITVTYGWHDEKPRYWSVEVMIEKAHDDKWEILNKGCHPALIAKHFPHLKLASRWHGSTKEGPLRFVEQATYWYNQWQHPPQAIVDWQRVNPEAALKTALVWGALSEDQRLPKLPPETLQRWLQKRLILLRQVMHADLQFFTQEGT